MILNPSRIKMRLKELDLSYSRFEDLAGLSDSTLKRALAGHALRPSSAAIMATALGTTVEWLCGSDEDEIKPEPITIEPALDVNEPDTEPEMSQPAIDVHFLISNMTASYDKALATKDEVIHQKNKWIVTLALALGVVAFAVIAWLIYDIASPAIGWVQY